jgi:argininosuccinate lyase
MADDMVLTEARLSSPPSERLLRYYQLPGLQRERRHFPQFLAVDLAHTVMLVEQGILPKPQGAAILRELLELRTIDADEFPVDPRKGSLLLQVEAHLSARLGEDVAGRMHTGRSRIDQGATVRRLFKRGRMLDVMDRLCGFQAAILAQAGRHRRTVMPGYTHMQHAQPWVLGHYLLSFFAKFGEDFQRLTEAYARVNLNPLGTVGLSGTSWPLDRRRTTALLGFSGLVENSKLGREAYYAAEAIAALSFVMCDLNDLATDLHLWSTYEFGMLETDDGYCGTSSIFPQKKNPSALETVKKAAGGAVNWLGTALATYRAEGTGDQAVRELPMIDGALDTTEGMTDLMTGIVDTLVVHEARMRELASSNWSTASNLADVIVREIGLSYRQTHHVVGRLVRICLAAEVPPAQATGALLDQAGLETLGQRIGLSDAQIRAALDADEFVRTRVTTGSVAPQEVDRMLGEARRQLEEAEGWIRRERARIAAAARDLEAAVQAVVAGANG